MPDTAPVPVAPVLLSVNVSVPENDVNVCLPSRVGRRDQSRHASSSLSLNGLFSRELLLRTCDCNRNPFAPMTFVVSIRRKCFVVGSLFSRSRARARSVASVHRVSSSLDMRVASQSASNRVVSAAAIERVSRAGTARARRPRSVCHASASRYRSGVSFEVALMSR